jgi:hypothetical protein
MWNIPQIYKKSIPVTDREGPWGCDTLRIPLFYTVRSQMAVRLSALRANRPLPSRKIHGAHFWVDPRDTVRLEGLGQFKNPVTPSGFEKDSWNNQGMQIYKGIMCPLLVWTHVFPNTFFSIQNASWAFGVHLIRSRFMGKGSEAIAPGPPQNTNRINRL